eukprot:65704_1
MEFLTALPVTNQRNNNGNQNTIDPEYVNPFTGNQHSFDATDSHTNQWMDISTGPVDERTVTTTYTQIDNTNEAIYGPYTYPPQTNLNNPYMVRLDIIKFHSDLSLWRTDFEKFIEHQINTCSIPPLILMIILEYIYDEIQSILQCPTHWIIQTTLAQTQSLQPFYKNRTSDDT